MEGRGRLLRGNRFSKEVRQRLKREVESVGTEVRVKHWLEDVMVEERDLKRIQEEVIEVEVKVVTYGLYAVFP